MDTLHKHNYSIENAMCSLVPRSGPVLCRDEMEEWSASEANLFEEALDKYGKDFNDIRNDFVSSSTYPNFNDFDRIHFKFGGIFSIYEFPHPHIQKKIFLLSVENHF